MLAIKCPLLLFNYGSRLREVETVVFKEETVYTY